MYGNRQHAQQRDIQNVLATMAMGPFGKYICHRSSGRDIIGKINATLPGN